jgi:hypothetical protein
MRKPAFCVALVAVIWPVVTAGPIATAAPRTTDAVGTVTVFSSEATPLTVWNNPHGCQKLPIDAHVLVNQTDVPVTIYADPFCLTPGLAVEPGHGSHVAAGSGAFSA